MTTLTITLQVCELAVYFVYLCPFLNLPLFHQAYSPILAPEEEFLRLSDASDLESSLLLETNIK